MPIIGAKGFLLAILILPIILLPFAQSRFNKKHDGGAFTTTTSNSAPSDKNGLPSITRATVRNLPTLLIDQFNVGAKRKVRSIKEKDNGDDDETSEEEEEEEAEIEATTNVDFMEDLSLTENPTTVNYDASNESNLPEAETATEAEDDFSLDGDAYRNSVHLKVSLLIWEITDVDEVNQIIAVILRGVISWKASNIDKHHFLRSRRWKNGYHAKPEFFQKMWKPNINFLQNVKLLSKKSFLNEPQNLIYFENKQRFYYRTTLQTVKLRCDMDFKYYPADIQNCKFTILDYNFDRIITMEWVKARGHRLADNNFAVQLQSYKGFRKFKHPDINYEAYKYLTFKISMRRKISYHVVQTYLPSTLYILITCLCFLVPSHMVEVRIGISMTTLLTLTAMFASVRESTPTVSYIKAIDIWMACCIFFVFLTLLEFTTLLWLRSQREVAEKRRLENQKRLDALKNVIGGKCVGGPVQGMLERSFSVEPLQYSRHEKFSELVEKYGFVVFSVVFLTFNVIYWSWLIEASRYYKWKINETINL